MKLNNNFEDFLCDLYSKRDTLSRACIIDVIKSYTINTNIYETESECLFSGDKENECWKVMWRCAICEHSKWYK